MHTQNITIYIPLFLISHLDDLPFLNNLPSKINVVHMCMDVGTSTSAWPHLQRRMILPSQQISNANGSSDRGGECEILPDPSWSSGWLALVQVCSWVSPLCCDDPWSLMEEDSWYSHPVKSLSWIYIDWLPPAHHKGTFLWASAGSSGGPESECFY